MSEVWFYHLERTSLADTLPPLLEKTLERGWRALVRTGSTDRLDQLDSHLWTYRDESFLPHGRADEEHAARQPVLLTLDADNANDAQLLLLTDPGMAFDPSAFERCVLVFDGLDEESVAKAREQWKTVKNGGHNALYWRQGEDGKWTQSG